MDYAKNLYHDLVGYEDALRGDYGTINNLTKRFEVVNSTSRLHYDLLDSAILQSGESYKILDIDVTGEDKSKFESIAIPLRILGFRLGKTFNDLEFQKGLKGLLDNFYEKHTYRTLVYWIHKKSPITSDLVNTMYDYGYEVFDKMMLNSVFGQIYYDRG